MKAVDTNVLIRFLVNDDEAQGAAVRSLLEALEKKKETVLITIPVLLEAIWVMESSYQCPRKRILEAIEQLTLMSVFRFEAPHRIHAFLDAAGRERIGLADVLIGVTGADLGCKSTLTFDKQAAKSSLFELLPHSTKGQS